jgi:ABC-type sugar transport system ATPase subunit
VAADRRPAVMDVPVLQLRNIDKRFLGVHALRGVSLDVHPGEVVALLGENGAGKSTLMKIASGIEQPDSGEVLIDGRAVVLRDVHTATSRTASPSSIRN